MMQKRLRGAQRGVGTYLGTRKGRVVLILIAVLFMTVGFKASGLLSTYLNSTDYGLVYKAGPRGTGPTVAIDEGTVLTEDDINDIYVDFRIVSPDLEAGTASLVFDIDDSVIATGIYGSYTVRISIDPPEYAEMEYIKIDVSNVYKGEHVYYIQFGGELVGSTYTFSIIGDATSPVYMPPDDGNGDNGDNGDNGEGLPTEPTVTHPDDINYTAGTTNNKIIWILQDDNPSRVEVFRDDERIFNNVWELNSLTVTVDIDGLSTGDYTYKIIGTDMDNNEVEDVVIVTVSGGIGDVKLEDIPIEYMLIGGVVFILLIGGRD